MTLTFIAFLSRHRWSLITDSTQAENISQILKNKCKLRFRIYQILEMFQAMILFLSIRTIEYEPCLIILVVAVVLEEVYIFSCQRIIRCTGMAGSFRQERDVVHAESEEILRQGLWRLLPTLNPFFCLSALLDSTFFCLPFKYFGVIGQLKKRLLGAALFV